MLKSPSLSWRVLTPRCTGGSASFINRCRAYASTSPDVPDTDRDSASPRKIKAGLNAGSLEWRRHQTNPSAGRKAIKRPTPSSIPKRESKDETPSLLEQLFPEEAANHEAEHAPHRHPEVPQLPLEPANPTFTIRREPEPENKYLQQLRHQMEESGPQTSVLVLRSASKHLTAEDFRRLIPQGKHIEGWTLERGDIQAVIPGRDLATLEHAGYYYLLFSSPLSAYTYQGHVTRIHTMISTFTPSSIYSPIPPAPGQLVQGLDVQSAIDAYALTAPGQTLILRQLKPPLSPLIAGIVNNRGYSSIIRRVGRSPFEVRLAFEGSQPSISKITHTFRHVAKARELGWNDDLAGKLPITKWEPQFTHNPLGSGSHTSANHARRESATHRERDEEEQLERDRAKRQDPQSRRTMPEVYIVGFDTEGAAQSFVQYWNGRALAVQDHSGNTGGGEAVASRLEDELDELPPIALVEML